MLCLVIALAFIAVFLISIVMSFARADGLPSGGNRGETVYVEADANGNPTSMISSVYIGNPEGADVIVDHTTLTDIRNIAGSEAPAIDGDAVTFAANGEDVCYQGAASGELPFSVAIRYYLDGVLIDPEVLAGKSGRVRIEVKTKNNLAREAVVDGEAMELYVPFSIICMLSLDDSFTAVTASGAKLSAQAGRITALAVLLPGLKESLGAGENERIKDGFVIEANAEEFSIGSMMFVGMTGIIDENDLSGVEDIEGLLGALDGVGAASTELYKGSKGITYALSDFGEGLSLYAEGVSEAARGAKEAVEGAEKLQEGMEALYFGMGQYALSVDQVVKTIDGARDKLNAAANPDAPVDQETRRFIEDAINEAVRENAKAAEARLRASLETRLAPYIPDEAERQAVIEGILADLALDEIAVSIDDETLKSIFNAVFATRQAQELIDLVNVLADGAGEFSVGASKLTSAGDALNSGAAGLAKGLLALCEGLEALDANGETMNKAMKSLARGSGKLTEGLKALSEEGLSAIVDETDRIGVSLSRKDALLSLAEGYTSFTCTKPSPGDTVQFMLTTEEIAFDLPIEGAPGATETPGVQETQEEENESSFFQRLGAWFRGAFDAIQGWFQ